MNPQPGVWERDKLAQFQSLIKEGLGHEVVGAQGNNTYS